MAITPQAGYMIDSNNPNGVIKIPDPIVTTPVNGGILPGSNVINQSKTGFDVFGNPIAAPAATAGSIYSGIGDSALNAGYNTLLTGAKSASEAPIDESAIRAQTLASFQAEIDAQNALYADKLASAKVTGANRLGSSTAIQARRGLLGSDFGAAQTDTTNNANNQVYNSINNEKAASIAGILSTARTAADNAVKEKTAAKQAGLENYVKYLSEAATRKTSNVQTAANLILNNNQTIEDLRPEDITALTTSYGISFPELKSAYNTAKATLDAKKSADAAAAAEAATKGQFNLGAGEQRYDASGKLIASGQDKPATLPQSAQEFEYAKSQGYTGSYTQYQNDDANRKIVIAKASGTSASDVSSALLKAIDGGLIDPNRINSRTIGLYNTIAGAGIDAVGSHAGASGETKAIEQLSVTRSNAVKTLGVIEANLPLVEGLADKVNTIGVPLLDSWITGKKALGTNNPDVVKYVNSLKTLRSEYAQMLAKGNVATEGDKAEAAQAIPAGLSSAAYAALGSQLKLETQNVLGSVDSAIKAAKDKSGSNVGAGASTGQTTTAPDGTVVEFTD